MHIEKNEITKLRLTDLDRLDPVCVFAEDFGPGQGQITITCFGKAWTSYWGGMGDRNIAEFFCDCDEHYIAKKLSDIDSETYDIDAIRAEAKKIGVDCWRDDPWNDYEFLSEMYGHEPTVWYYYLPKMPNPDYEYLCRIIVAVQSALKVSLPKDA